jgi:exodeoxyribonuclease-3
LDFKLRYYAAFLEYAKKLMKTRKTLVVCGDINTAHTELDLERPKENSGVSGFLPEERKWLDTFRVFNKEGGHYSWWDMKTHARSRNVGWRLDYFYMDAASLPKLKEAFILDSVQGSDHCPVGITLELP